MLSPEVPRSWTLKSSIKRKPVNLGIRFGTEFSDEDLGILWARRNLPRKLIYHFCHSRTLAMMAFEVLALPFQKDRGDGIKWEKSRGKWVWGGFHGLSSHESERRGKTWIEWILVSRDSICCTLRDTVRWNCSRSTRVWNPVWLPLHLLRFEWIVQLSWQEIAH
jgi:hypothetical protein